MTTAGKRPDPGLREAIALHRSGRLAEAARLYEQVLAADPAQFDALHLLGVVAAQTGDHRRAAGLIGRAIAIDPGHAAAHRNLGLALRELGLADRAVESFERALALKPDYVDAWNNLGNALRELGRPERALACYDRALALKPEFAEGHYNRAMALLDLRRLEQALAGYDRAIGLKPDYAEAWNNRGKALKELVRLDEAIASYDRAIALKPDHAKAHWNKALALLMTGRFEEGWALYEWGWPAGERGDRREFPAPLWLGAQPLEGKRILLHAEQGLGDNIQFCRYARLVADRGATVILEVPPALLPLVKTLDGPAELVATGDELPPFDYHCPMLSLPLALGTTLATVPGRTPYLRSDAAKVKAWDARLGARAGLRVGIAWSSVSTHPEDAKRSLALSTFLDGLPEAGFEWICLQKVIRDSDRTALAARPDIRFCGSELEDFGDTAALVECLDLTVSVDTSVAHLAGALGKPVWILLPRVPDYRWLLGRDDSPWYPTAKLYRQSRADDWSDVLERARADLAALAAAGSPRR